MDERISDARVDELIVMVHNLRNSQNVDDKIM
jgi:hypothetical protein